MTGLLRTMAALLTILDTSAIAEAATTPPTIVQDRDEAARYPYQQGMDGTCQYAGDCVLVYPVVGDGRRRVIDHVTCRFVVPSGATLTSATLSTEAFRTAREYLPINNIIYDGGYQYVTVNLQTEVFFQYGEQPRVDTFTDGGALASLSCTLTGHDIFLP